MVRLTQELASGGPRRWTMGGMLSEKPPMTQWHINVFRLFRHPFLLHTWDIRVLYHYYSLWTFDFPTFLFYFELSRVSPYPSILGFAERIRIITSCLCWFESQAFWLFSVEGDRTFTAFLPSWVRQLSLPIIVCSWTPWPSGVEANQPIFCSGRTMKLAWGLMWKMLGYMVNMFTCHVMKLSSEWMTESKHRKVKSKCEDGVEKRYQIPHGPQTCAAKH